MVEVEVPRAKCRRTFNPSKHDDSSTDFFFIARGETLKERKKWALERKPQ